MAGVQAAGPNVPPGVRPQQLLQSDCLAGWAAQLVPHRHRHQLLLAEAEPLLISGELVAVQQLLCLLC